MSSFFHNNREGQTKRESKGRRKKVTTNSFNEQFTIYANVLNSNFSEQVITPQKINHKKIQIMKQTLKSQHDDRS